MGQNKTQGERWRGRDIKIETEGEESNNGRKRRAGGVTGRGEMERRGYGKSSQDNGSVFVKQSRKLLQLSVSGEADQQTEWWDPREQGQNSRWGVSTVCTCVCVFVCTCLCVCVFFYVCVHA